MKTCRLGLRWAGRKGLEEQAKQRETGKGIPGGRNSRSKGRRAEAEQNSERLWGVYLGEQQGSLKGKLRLS